ncbi:MAG: glycosyltransferase [Dehalococcoidia bacterium]|nr:glycosyltransferase [Dehalococcoidia bacterium]
MSTNRNSPSEPLKRVLIICHETIGENMAGPAVRSWEIAAALVKHMEVTLAHSGQSRNTETSGFRLATYDSMNPRSLTPLIAWADVVMLHCFLLHRLPVLINSRKPIVVDVYDPFVFENLEHRRNLPGRDQMKASAADMVILNDALRLGDFFICANERQRDFWLGMLLANGRVNPLTHGIDQTLRSLVDIVPFGVSSTPPVKTTPALKGVHPGIGVNDRLLLWGGGLWDWLDPVTLVKALAIVGAQRSDVKLYFMAKQHLDPTVVPAMRMATQTIEMSRQLGLLDKNVFFGDWIPYRNRANYLLEADIGVSIHPDSIETRFAFRTRLMDYIWAQLPILTTAGDSLSDMVAAEALGRCVPPGDIDALAAAVLEMLADQDLRTRLAPNFARVAERYTWDEITKPLVRYLTNPKPAKDRLGEPVVPRDRPSTGQSVSPEEEPLSRRRLSYRTWQRLRKGGLQAACWDIRQHFKWWRAYRRYGGSHHRIN